MPEQSHSKIYVAGHRGMVGFAIVRHLLGAGHALESIITRTHANDTYPADLNYQNLMVQASVMEAAFQNGVQELLFLGSSCIYPREGPQPMVEDALLTGPLEPINEPYAIAKIAGIKPCESYNRQYGASHGVDYRSVMPTNLYGPGDNYHPENSYFIPALIRRFSKAKASQAKLHYGELSDSGNLTRTIKETQADESHNVGAQSHLAVSFDSPEYIADVDGMGTLRRLEAIRILGAKKRFRCGELLRRAQHGCPRRGETFVTRKITRGLANISQGLEDCLYMGNIDALRDWGHAKDYVRMQWILLQQEQAEDFVIARGLQYSVRQFIEWSAAALGMSLRWAGQGADEVGYWNDKPVVKIDPRYFRPTEVATLLGDPSKAKQKLGWVPEITAQEMCKEMVANDLAQAKQHALLLANGYRVNVSVE